jgi:hypothetical protein
LDDMGSANISFAPGAISRRDQRRGEVEGEVAVGGFVMAMRQQGCGRPSGA